MSWCAATDDTNGKNVYNQKIHLQIQRPHEINFIETD